MTLRAARRRNLRASSSALMYQGDVTLEHVIGAIQASPAWSDGHNAIVIVWDESDYSNAPITNKVTLIVDTNDGRAKGIVSNRFYTHFSLLRSMESALGLPCLNNACNAPLVMDVFGSTER